MAVGGFLGADARFFLKSIQILDYNGSFPLNTMLINILGCFLLAAILTLAFEIMEFDADIRLGVATGFLGAFTTFSTLCKETADLLATGHYASAFSYVALSTLLGLLSAYLGTVAARETILKIFIRSEERDDAIADID